MALPSPHQAGRDLREPVERELRAFRVDGEDVTVGVRLRRAGDGAWVGALVYRPAGGGERHTAEILRGASEEQVWDSVRGLGAHHLRDLYRSLT